MYAWLCELVGICPLCPICIFYCLKTNLLNGHLYLDGLWLKCDSKNEHKKDMHLKEISLCAQTMITFLISKINIIGGTYMTI